MEGFVKIHNTIININCIKLIYPIQIREDRYSISIDIGKPDYLEINMSFNFYNIKTNNERNIFLNIINNEKDILDSYLLIGKLTSDNVFFSPKKLKALLKKQLDNVSKDTE